MPLADATRHGRLHQSPLSSAWDASREKEHTRSDHPALSLEEVTDPTTIAQAARCARNIAWLQAHAAEIYQRYYGKHLCSAGEALFVADTPEEAWALATAAYPEDDGRFLSYISRQALARSSA